jgi:hypothetical protein
MFNTINDEIGILESSNEKQKRKLSTEEVKMVVFAIDRKLGISTESIFENLTHDEFIELDFLADQRNCLWDELASLSPDQLRKRYEEERSIFDDDAETIFQKLSTAKAREWARKDAWSLDEAIALSLGFLPRHTMRGWAERNNAHCKPAQEFIEMAELTRTAIATRKLFDPVEPELDPEFRTIG